MSTRAAVVLLSGGQDSTTCLAWAKQQFDRLYSIAFDYGQRHRVELDAAAAIAQRAGVVEHRVVTVSALAELGGTTLLGDASAPDLGEHGKGDLPNTFVPGRNLVFLSLAAAWAWQLGVNELVTGVCETDYSGYPDCRQSTIAAMQNALAAGLDVPVRICTPLMQLSKAETVLMLRELGHLDWLADSHTCYRGSRPPCGTCPACVLRAKGFAEAGVVDPLLAAADE